MSEWAPGGAQRSLVPTSDLMSCLVLFTGPPRAGRGAASSLTGNDPSASEGRVRAGAKRGAGGGEDNSGFRFN